MKIYKCKKPLPTAAAFFIPENVILSAVEGFLIKLENRQAEIDSASKEKILNQVQDDEKKEQKNQSSQIDF